MQAPSFRAELLTSFGATLPLLTQMVIHVSDWMKSHWYIVVGSPIAAVWLFIYVHGGGNTNHTINGMIVANGGWPCKATDNPC